MEEQVVRYFICDELLGGRRIRAAVHGGDYKIPAAEQYAALLAFENVHTNLLRWWTWNESRWQLAPDDVAKTKPRFDAAAAALVATLDGKALLAHQVRERELVHRGFAPDIAAELARAPLMREVFALLSTKGDLTAAAGAFHRVARELHVDAFDEILASQVPANAWERRFFTSLEREASSLRKRAAEKLLADKDFIARNRERIDRIGDALQTVRQLGARGLVPLFLILEDYRALA